MRRNNKHRKEQQITKRITRLGIHAFCKLKECITKFWTVLLFKSCKKGYHQNAVAAKLRIDAKRRINFSSIGLIKNSDRTKKAERIVTPGCEIMTAASTGI